MPYSLARRTERRAHGDERCVRGCAARSSSLEAAEAGRRPSCCAPQLPSLPPLDPLFAPAPSGCVQRILREIKLMRLLEHENLVQLVDIVIPSEKPDYDDLYIIRCVGGAGRVWRMLVCSCLYPRRSTPGVCVRAAA